MTPRAERFEAAETFRDVTPRVERFEAVETFRVVEFIKGIVRVSKLKIVFDAFDVNPAATMLVVVRVFDTTRFVNGWTMLEAWMFERVFPKMRDEGMVPNKFDEFKDEIEEPFPAMVRATTEFKFEIPKTFRVLAP